MTNSNTTFTLSPTFRTKAGVPGSPVIVLPTVIEPRVEPAGPVGPVGPVGPIPD